MFGFGGHRRGVGSDHWLGRCRFGRGVDRRLGGRYAGSGERGLRRLGDAADGGDARLRVSRRPRRIESRFVGSDEPADDAERAEGPAGCAHGAPRGCGSVRMRARVDHDGFGLRIARRRPVAGAMRSIDVDARGLGPSGVRAARSGARRAAKRPFAPERDAVERTESGNGKVAFNGNEWRWIHGGDTRCGTGVERMWRWRRSKSEIVIAGASAVDRTDPNLEVDVLTTQGNRTKRVALLPSITTTSSPSVGWSPRSLAAAVGPHQPPPGADRAHAVHARDRLSGRSVSGRAAVVPAAARGRAAAVVPLCIKQRREAGRRAHGRLRARVQPRDDDRRLYARDLDTADGLRQCAACRRLRSRRRAIAPARAGA